MDELRESSLLFSLEGLLETERERVQREAREAQRRREEELARVAEHAARRRLTLEQERQSRERRQQLEAERERMDVERVAAMKQATIERARLETEAKVRLVELEQTRRHELLMSQLREGQRTLHYRTLTWVSSAVALLSIVAGVGAYFGYLRPAHAREQQTLQANLRVDGEKLANSEHALAAEQRRSQTLSERVAQLEERTREPAPAAQEPSSSPSRLSAKPGKPHFGPAPTPTPVVSNACPDDGDPLRACLSTKRR